MRSRTAVQASVHLSRVSASNSFQFSCFGRRHDVAIQHSRRSRRSEQVGKHSFPLRNYMGILFSQLWRRIAGFHEVKVRCLLRPSAITANWRWLRHTFS